MLYSIVACSNNYAIGINNKMPWHIPKDLEYFKKTTLNNTIIMGRKTFESLPGVLNNRKHIVLTTNKNYVINDVNVIIEHNMDKLLKEYSNSSKKAFIIGGGDIYRKSLSYIDKLYLTRIYADFEADTYFPHFEDKFVIDSSSEIFIDKSGLKFQFIIYNSIKNN